MNEQVWGVVPEPSFLHILQAKVLSSFKFEFYRILMKPDDIIRIKEILDESCGWEPEVLERMPKLFLLIRENYLRGLSAGNTLKREKSLQE